MSCYVVSQKHISAILRWACRNNLKAGWGGNPSRYAYQPGQEQEAFDLLYAANVKSVNERYNETSIESGPSYLSYAPELTPIEVIKACDCLAYQCDEWSGFEGSDADRILRSIKEAAIQRLPGYDAASWSIS